MKSIVTYLTFKEKALEAVEFYVSVFKNSKIINKTINPLDLPMLPKGAVLNINFELNGVPFMAMDGGSYFKFSQGISLLVNCESQEEIDHYWTKLSKGGMQQQCGWLTDKYGVSWQIVPGILDELMSDPDPEKTSRVIKAVLGMKKIEINKLLHAAVGV